MPACMRASLLLVCVAPLALLTGCASIYAHERAAYELGCPESEVHVSSVSFGGFEASGCGREVDVACTNRGFCVREGDVRVTAMPTPRPIPPLVSGATTFDQVGVRAAVTPVVAAAAAACRAEAGPHGMGDARLTFG